MRAVLSSLIFLYLWIVSKAATSDIHEICDKETFQARCEDDEMIIIRLGRYGRMKDSRCVSRKHGPIGCSRSARIYLDQLCSGRRKCDVIVATLIPADIQPCAKDYSSYLEVAYDCVKVATIGGRHCDNEGPRMLRPSSGFLSSVIAEETGCGSHASPWVISVSPGQRIKMTLFNFGSLRPRRLGSTCIVFAVVKETTKGKSETICAKPTRENIEYESLGNKVEVRLMQLENREEPNNENSKYLMKYEAIGCPDIAAPPGGWMVRLSDTEMLYGCNNSVSKRWRVHCEGTTWEEKIQNCSQAAALTNSESNSFWEFFHLPTEISIVLITCIAVVVGCFILAVGVVYLKCLRGKRNYAENIDSTMTTNTPATFPNISDQAADRKCTDPSDAYQSVGSSENDYYRTWQLQRHAQGGVVIPPPPTAAADDVARASLNASRGYVEHIYESPIFERRPTAYCEYSPADASKGTDYFELDIRPSPHCKHHRYSDGAIQRTPDH